MIHPRELEYCKQVLCATALILRMPHQDLSAPISALWRHAQRTSIGPQQLKLIHEKELHRKRKWGSLEDIRKIYPDADGITIGSRIYTVFNICGNQFRLVVQINYQHKMIFFKRLMKHAEYDRNEWKKSQKREQEKQGVF